MKKQKLLIIETSDVGARHTAEAAIKLGFDPVFLCQLELYQQDTLAQILCYEHYNISTGSAAELAEFIQLKNLSAFGVITFLDSRLHVAVELAKILNIKSLDPCVTELKDKCFSQKIAPDYFPSTIYIKSDESLPPQLGTMLNKFGQLAVKPCYTAGAVGFTVVKSKEDLEKLPYHFANTQIPQHLHPTSWMAQQFVSGELLSVEGYVQNESIQIFGISGRQKIGNTETVSVFPALSDLAVQKKLEIHNRCLDFVKKSKMQYGFFHIEVLASDENVFIIDTNMGRVGGGGIAEQLSIAMGLKPEDFFAQVIQVSLNLATSEDKLQILPDIQTACIMYGLGQPGFVKKIVSTQPVSSYHTVIWGPEQKIFQQGVNNWSWVGILTGRMPQVLHEAQQLLIQTERGLETPVF